MKNLKDRAYGVLAHVVGWTSDALISVILPLQVAFWPHRAQSRAIRELRLARRLHEAEPTADPWKVVVLHVTDPASGPMRVRALLEHTTIVATPGGETQVHTRSCVLNAKADLGMPVLNRCMHVLLTRWADLEELHAVVGRDGLAMIQPPGDTYAFSTNATLPVTELTG